MQQKESFALQNTCELLWDCVKIALTLHAERNVLNKPECGHIRALKVFAQDFIVPVGLLIIPDK